MSDKSLSFLFEDEMISENLLIEFREFLAQHMGLEFPEKRLPELRRSIDRAAPDLGFKDVDSCVKQLMSEQLTSHRTEVLASYLTIGETYFFRDEKSFKVLEERIFMDLLRKARSSHRLLRIWSAACSTGEEPYSIAILLRRILPDFDDWNVTIVATDINTRSLEKASQGVYTEWSFRGAPPWLKQQYFEKTRKGHFRIVPEIKRAVKFAYHNLAQDPYPSLLNNTNGMNVIFCRNTLMYFGAEQRQKAIRKFIDCLLDGGWLIVSPAETSLVVDHRLETVSAQGTMLHRKIGGPARKVEISETAITLSQTPVHRQAVPEPPSHETTEYLQRLSGTPSSMKFDLPSEVESRAFSFEEALELYREGRYSEVTKKLPVKISRVPLHGKESASEASLLARAYANQGMLIEALEWCAKATTADKLNPRYHYLFATILQEQGRNEEAVKSLQKAIYLDQDFVLAHFALGNLLLSQKNSARSQKYFDNVLNLLRKYENEETLPESDGMTAGRLKEIVRAMTHSL